MNTSKHNNTYAFEVSGSFFVESALRPFQDVVGNIAGFRLPDGRKVDLAVCLRVEEPDGKEKWVISDKEMAQLGFDNLDYDRLEFRASHKKD